MRIRDATNSDVTAILAIYNDVVANTTAIYDEHPSTLEERQAWFDARRADPTAYMVQILAELREESDARSFADSHLFPCPGITHDRDIDRHP